MAAASSAGKHKQSQRFDSVDQGGDIERLREDLDEQVWTLLANGRLGTTHQQDGQFLENVITTANRFGELQAVHDRHHEVRDHQLRPLTREYLECFLTIARNDGHIAFILKCEPKNVGDQVLVINDEDGCHFTAIRQTSATRIS
jgi:hypothetical protein